MAKIIKDKPRNEGKIIENSSVKPMIYLVTLIKFIFNRQLAAKG